MPTSINGWPVLFSGDKRLRTGVVPGTSKHVTLRDEFLPLALALLVDLNAKVVPLSTGPLDGWEVRAARTSSAWSNHASATAFDIHYSTTDKHFPAWPADHQRHCTPAQIAAVHTILDKYVTADGRRVLGWGGDWTVGTYCDEMHFEIGAGWEPRVGRPVTVGDIREVITRLGIRPDGTSRPLVATVTIGGRTPLTAREIAHQLGVSWARVVRFNARLLVARAKPGSVVRVPPGAAAVPLYAGAHEK